MGKSLENQEHTEDQLKQVEFLHTTVTRYNESQNEQYRDLTAKMTFLFGFLVVVLTFYGTYANNSNLLIKYLALGSFGITAVLLCLTLQNRKYARPSKLDSDVKHSNYFSKIYKDVSNIERVCEENYKPLHCVEKYLTWAIWAFTFGLVFLILSFVFQPRTMINSVHDNRYNHSSPRETTR